MDNKSEVIELLIKCGKILGIDYHPVKIEKTEEQKEIEEINKIVYKYRKKKIKQKRFFEIEGT